jgi:hypothetical protein
MHQTGSSFWPNALTSQLLDLPIPCIASSTRAIKD